MSLLFKCWVPGPAPGTLGVRAKTPALAAEEYARRRQAGDTMFVVVSDDLGRATTFKVVTRRTYHARLAP